MSFFRRAHHPYAKIENVIGASTRFSGHLKTEGGIRIDGTVEGTVQSTGNVIIGEEARVTADVIGYNITVAGFVEGNMYAADRLEIRSSGSVRGNVIAESLLIEEGGMFHGQSFKPDEATMADLQSADDAYLDDERQQPSPAMH